MITRSFLCKQSVALKKNRVGSLFESVALQSLTEVRVWLRNLDDPLF